jgi:hypothetical protein
MYYSNSTKAYFDKNLNFEKLDCFKIDKDKMKPRNESFQSWS